MSDVVRACEKVPIDGAHCGSEGSREELHSSIRLGEPGQVKGKTGEDVNMEVTGEHSSIELPGGLFISTEFLVRERMRGPLGNGGRAGRATEGRR